MQTGLSRTSSPVILNFPHVILSEAKDLLSPAACQRNGEKILRQLRLLRMTGRRPGMLRDDGTKTPQSASRGVGTGTSANGGAEPGIPAGNGMRTVTLADGGAEPGIPANGGTGIIPPAGGGLGLDLPPFSGGYYLLG